MLWLILILILVLFYVIPNPKPMFGVYNRPGKWFYLKASFIYLSIQQRKWKASKNRKEGDGTATSGYGVKAKQNEYEMEKAQPLKDHPLAIDAVLFSSGGKDGSYLVAAQARRKLMMNNTIFCMRIPNVGVLTHPKHPDTTLFTDTDGSWSAEGLELDLVEPMKKWRLYYKGPMINQITKETHQVELKGEYTSDLPYFDFDSDMDPWTVARAFAKEPWSKEYFDRIRKAHQNHYEQFGDIKGTVDIDGQIHDLDLNVMRDHTHGSTRDWRLMHRYGIQNFTTEDGFRGFIGVVCQPSTFTGLEIGYIYTKSGECLPVTEVDLSLWKHGEGGKDPKDFAFRFKAGDKWHYVQVKVLDTVELYIGWQWEARILERFCEYLVDGVPGWGVSEWHYRNWTGRPKRLQEKDPEHTHTVNKYG